MTTTKPSLFAALLRTVADWASARHGTPKPSARAERRRRARQRLKGRAALADLYVGYAADLNRKIDQIGADAQRQQAAMADLVDRNVALILACGAHQQEAARWRAIAEGSSHSPEMPEKIILN
ncbi:hypothetical protein [Xanthobacter versatilis]|uniref:hypothetical protein n=1 Tax=Xanthobacter autotrophicus (strain ATCC BAA-1158 / Py2) TaxID=78245 RepID=UPI0037293F17